MKFGIETNGYIAVYNRFDKKPLLDIYHNGLGGHEHILQIQGKFAQKIAMLLYLGNKSREFNDRSNCHTTCDYLGGYNNKMGTLGRGDDYLYTSPDTDAWEENCTDKLKYGFREMDIKEAEKEFGFPFLCRVGIDMKQKFSDKKKPRKSKSKSGDELYQEDIKEKQQKEILRNCLSYIEDNYRNEIEACSSGKDGQERIKYIESLLEKTICPEHSFVILGKDLQGRYVCFEKAGKTGPFCLNSSNGIYFGSLEYNYLSCENAYFAPINQEYYSNK
ncbi:hypothetical protein CSB09_04850 [Candidatus Gracilibacteria bacterium]|nr:MAG: hypothetical protein CSB09_04850 [Candidatus Gracilibacteria bacterium]